MQLKRAWKPVALAAAVAIGAFSLLYSCKKFDPHEYLNRKPVPEDTATFGKKKFIEIGKRTFTDEKPLADTISALPLKPRTIVDSPGSE